ncbi:MAG: hypothetical protein IT176_01520 [Acidobacteria bacterium]|nr:hypothetical protein [Acidobacteriota bacterium]
MSGWPAVQHAGVQLAGLLLLAVSVRAIDPLELAASARAPARSGCKLRAHIAGRVVRCLSGGSSRGPARL